MVEMKSPPKSRKSLLRECRKRGLPVSAATGNIEMRKMLTSRVKRTVMRKWSKVVTAATKSEALKLLPDWVSACPISKVRFTRMTARGEKNKAWLVVEYEVPVGS